jgi:1,4-alpha-glucan branching enzyme
MGANLVANGATFRVWAPGAEKVYVIGDFNAWAPSDPCLLQARPGGHGAGFLPEVNDGTFYKFWVQGTGTSGRKRDPYARDLEDAWPNPKCIVRASDTYTWQDSAWLPFPSDGHWFEVFNSDVYENWVNPWTAGNGGGVQADGPGLHGLAASASLTIPANSVLVFARDPGD